MIDELLSIVKARKAIWKNSLHSKYGPASNMEDLDMNAIDAAYTPGPWVAVSEHWEEHDWGGEDWEVHTVAGHRVAVMCGPQSHSSPEANARLIAAAPETAQERDRLKAVNMNLTYALRTLAGPLPHGSKDDVTAFCRRVACAALDKAKPAIDETCARLLVAAPETAQERDHLKAINAELVTLAEDVIGFCVALREDKLCWRDHPDAGVLFSRARAVLAKARKEG